MERSSSQILFNYMPGKTFDHETHGVVCQVDRVDGDRLDQMDRATLVARVNKRLDDAVADNNLIVNYSNKNRRDPASWSIKRPMQLRARVFPLLLQCRLGCKRVYALNPDGSGPKRRDCPVCHNKLSQVQAVLFHECGTLRSLEIPSCDAHGRAHMTLDDRGSLYASDWRWVCRASGCDKRIVRPLSRVCDCGIYTEKLLRTDIFRASHVYRPLKEQIIDFPVKERRLFVENSEAVDATLAAFLGIGEDRLGNQEELQAQIAAIETLIAQLQQSKPDLARQLRDEVEQKRRAATLGQYVDQYFGADTKEVISRAVLDYVIAKRGVGFESWRAYVSDEALRDVIAHALEGIGIEDLSFSPSFPTSLIVYGFSRGGSDTGRAAIIGFSRDSDNHVMFGSENKSDAVLVQLSPKRLLRKVGIEEDNPTAARAQLARVVLAGGPASDAIGVILHTFAHAFMKACSTWSGLESNSLSEYLFPAAGAFAIYEIVGAGISMGGIHRMVERNLPSVIDRFLTVVASCMYDPACIERRGACFACVQVADISCQEFNQNLDRRLLIGQQGYLGGQ
jgi:hypothetical protein